MVRAVAEKPIIFSAPMIRALLEGRKTQTRRFLRLPLWRGVRGSYGWRPFDPSLPEDREAMALCGPYGATGDLLWVRERWRTYCAAAGELQFADDTVRRCGSDEFWAHKRSDGRWASPIHMPRWASRLTLRVESVRVERVQEITDKGAAAEGVRCYICDGPVDGMSENDCACFHSRAAARESFEMLWNSINGKKPGRAWADDPWVWVIGFSVVQP